MLYFEDCVLAMCVAFTFSFSGREIQIKAGRAFHSFTT